MKQVQVEDKHFGHFSHSDVWHRLLAKNEEYHIWKFVLPANETVNEHFREANQCIISCIDQFIHEEYKDKPDYSYYSQHSEYVLVIDVKHL